MKLTKNISLQEVVPKATFEKWGERAIYFIDKRIILASQSMIDRYGSCIMNNWASGGQFDGRGYRPPEETTGGKESQHRFGRAIDLDPVKITPQEMYADMMKNQELILSFGITTVEDIAMTPTWIHIDNRPVVWDGRQDKLLIVKPIK